MKSGAALAAAGLRAQSRTRPNILLLMADQFRADCLGADGNRAIHTPNLDRIAREGARFRCGYSSMPTCTPARSGAAHGPRPVEPRHAEDGPHGGALPGGEAARARRRRLLHLLHRQVPLPSAAQRARLRSTAARRVAARRDAGFRSDYRAWFWSQAPTDHPTSPASAGTTTPPSPTRCPSAFTRPSGPGKRPSISLTVTTARSRSSSRSPSRARTARTIRRSASGSVMRMRTCRRHARASGPRNTPAKVPTPDEPLARRPRCGAGARSRAGATTAR